MSASRQPGRNGPLRGTSVLVAGAGLSGLVAARALAANGARVRVIEARERLGGRVHTIRGGQLGNAHAEAGGEFVDAEHRRLRVLARELGIQLTPILRRGFGTAIEYDGRLHVSASQVAGWRELRRALGNAIDVHREHDGDWHGSLAAAIGRQSLVQLLAINRATPRVIGFAQALRGFFVADPSELSALVAVDQLIAGNPGAVKMSRISGGADRLITRIVRSGRLAIDVGHVLRRIRQAHDTVSATIETPGGALVEHTSDFVVISVPPPLVRQIAFDPPLPESSIRALATFAMGAGTKVLLRFNRRWWRKAGRANAFGTNLPIGAVWEAAEDQRQTAVLTLLAGGSASAQLQSIFRSGGAEAVVARLSWLGAPEPARGSLQVAWEHEAWSRGAYGVVSPRFDPHDQELLGRAVGRVLFAGEHTSRKTQGYMEGAVESGERAAAEVESLVRLRYA